MFIPVGYLFVFKRVSCSNFFVDTTAKKYFTESANYQLIISSVNIYLNNDMLPPGGWTTGPDDRNSGVVPTPTCGRQYWNMGLPPLHGLYETFEHTYSIWNAIYVYIYSIRSYIFYMKVDFVFRRVLLPRLFPTGLECLTQRFSPSVNANISVLHPEGQQKQELLCFRYLILA